MDLAPPGILHDLFLKRHSNGHLTLNSIFEDGAGWLYFDKDLGSNGAECFTIEFNSIDDLIAVPCEVQRCEPNLCGN